MVAHTFDGQIFTGHQDGSVAIYDVKQQKVISRTTLAGAITSLSILNHGLHLAAGSNNGSLSILQTKGEFKQVTTLESVHQSRNQASVNQVISLVEGQESDNQHNNNSLPLIVSCGADGKVVLSEYNLYQAQPDDNK